jgi:hypothetical protein
VHHVRVGNAFWKRRWAVSAAISARPPVHHGCRGRAAPTCGGVYRCATCRRRVGFCLGASDAYPADCDSCANRKHKAALQAPSKAKKNLLVSTKTEEAQEKTTA